MITDNKQEATEATDLPLPVNLFTRLTDEYRTKMEARAAINYKEYRDAKELLKEYDNFSNLKLSWLDLNILCEAIGVPMEHFPAVFK